MMAVIYVWLTQRRIVAAKAAMKESRPRELLLSLTAMTRISSYNKELRRGYGDRKVQRHVESRVSIRLVAQ